MGNEWDDIPTVGEWLQDMPKWKHRLFNIISAVFGDSNAIDWLGYSRAKRRRQ